jgi:hypothetical protein
LFKQASAMAARSLDSRDPMRERRDGAHVGLGNIPPEIAFLGAQGVRPGVLLQAARAARQCGAAVDEVLLGDGLVGEGFYYQALARHLRIPFFDGETAFDEALDPAKALATGVAPLTPNALGLRAVVAPRGVAIRFLIAAAAEGRSAAGLALTSPRILGELVRKRAAAKVAEAASSDLERRDPHLCAHAGPSWPQIACAAAALSMAAALASVAPGALQGVISTLLWAVFAAWIVLRNLAVAAASDSGGAETPLEDAALPVYSILAPLYREANMVAKLVGAFEALDYPGIM